MTAARLLLRPLTPADAPAVFAACSDPRLTEHTYFPTHRTLAESEAFVATPPPGEVRAICVAGEAVGCLGWRWFDEPAGVLELGYWLNPAAWGRGYATEAVTAVVPHLFGTLPVERLQARVFDGNPASDRVLVKCGFRFEGTLRGAALVKGRRRDVRIYSRLRSEAESG